MKKNSAGVCRDFRQRIIRHACVFSVLALLLFIPRQAWADEAAEKTAFKFFTVQMELPPSAACGIMANIYRESGFIADITGPGGSYGLCQWMSFRKTNLVNFCQEKGVGSNTLKGQLMFIQHEMDTLFPELYEKLKGLPNTPAGAYQAGYSWCFEFERPSDTAARSAERGALARDDYFVRYGSDICALTADDVDAGITLDWIAKSRTVYVVLRSTKKSSNYKKIAQTAAGAGSYTDKSVKPGVTYYYQLRILKDGKISSAPASNTASAVHAKRLSDSACVVKPVETVTYTGKEQKPAVSISYDGTQLTEGVDFIAEYSDNVNAGTASVLLTGTGSYAGKKTVHFTIGKAVQRIRGLKSLAYTYTTKRRTVSAKAVGALTMKTGDRSIAYFSQGKLRLRKTGMTTITVTAAETKNYKAAVRTVRLVVVPAKPTITSLKMVRKASTYQRFRLTWNAPGEPDGIEVQCTTSPVFRSWAKTVSVRNSRTYVMIKTIRKNKSWNFRIRAYKEINGKIFYSKWSDVQVVG